MEANLRVESDWPAWSESKSAELEVVQVVVLIYDS